MRSPEHYRRLTGGLLFVINSLFAEVSTQAAETFKQHVQSQWLNQTSRHTEAITRNPKSVIGSDPKLIMEKSEDHQHRQQLEHFYHGYVP